MILTAILTGIFCGLTIAVGGWVLYVIIKRELRRTLAGFVTPPDDKTPSQLAVLSNQLAVLFAQHAVQQAKTTLMGMSSVDSRNATKETISGNPVLSLLAGVLPKKLLNAVAGNPVVLDKVMGYLSKNQAENAGGNGHTPAGVQSTFSLYGGKQ